MKPGGNEILSSLHAEYIALAIAENDEKDFLDADHFASKAIQVYGGTDAGLDGIKSSKIPAGTAAALKAAEKRLDKVLKSGAADYAPQQMAKSYAMYNCWLQEQEEGHQPDHIRTCLIAYIDAMDAVDDAKPMERVALPPKT